ncbi:MAG: crotonase/enoyl-CoA hydratase family protein [Proteobacteria bacterium]|nr:crotonase/enoyl-CoA hydratase family protein [Pseudomonadota bacterium]
MTESTLTVELRDHVLHMGLDRARKRNAFDLQLLRELAEAYTRMEEDPEVRCGLLFAHGDHFTAGLDLAEVGPAVSRGEQLFPAEAVDPLQLFGRGRSKPVVLAVQGYCFTIGIELALACDVRVAAAGTRFRQMEVARGIMPFGGATLRFPTLLGWGDAMKWLLTGAEFTAAEALRIGLIQEVVADGEQFAAAGAVAARIAAQAPLAVQATRRNAALAVEHGPAEARAALMGEARRLMHTQDAAEGLASFVERREARFKGL